MTAKIIAVVNQKGGAGKTTVAMQLAGTLARRGSKTLVVDADPQGTASRWALSANPATPFPAAIARFEGDPADLPARLRAAADSPRYLVVDTPPAPDSPVTAAVLSVADLAVVPLNPSPLDIWASVGIKAAIDRARRTNPNLAARLVVNQLQPNTTIGREILDLLPEFEIPVLKTSLGARTAFKECAAFGGTVHDIGARAEAAIEEVNSLVVEVLHALVKR